MEKKGMSSMAAAVTGLFTMVVLAGILIAVSEPLYKAIAGRNRPVSDVPIYKAGVYEGSARGYGGTVTLKVSVSEYEIEDVFISAPDETPEIGQAAAGKLSKEIWMKQSYSVDSISGATQTSHAVRAALGECLKEAAKEGSEPAAYFAAEEAGKNAQDSLPGVDELLKEAADGTHSYVSGRPDDKGFRDVMEVTVKDHKITALTWDAVNADGIGKRQLSKDGNYTMTENGPKWYEQADTLARYVIDNQSEEGMNDGSGYAGDAIASVSIYIGGFEESLRECLMQ